MPKALRFLVKFGKKEHIEGIPSGRVFFSNAKKMNEIESEQLKNGQGDTLDGKTRFQVNRGYMESLDGLFRKELPEGALIDVMYQNVSNAPIFCLSAIYDDDLEVTPDGRVSIHVSPSFKKTILDDFQDSDHALLITNPANFIHSIQTFFGTDCYAEEIHYFSGNLDGKLNIDYARFISKHIEESQQTSEELLGQIVIHMDKDNSIEVRNITTNIAYRVLFCKDKQRFEHQQEFRFVAHGHSIPSPLSLQIQMADLGSYLIPIDQFMNGYTLPKEVTL